MARSAMAGWEERFDDYVERLGDVLGHADRRAPLRAYTTGLLLPGEREGVEARGGRGACRGGAPRRSAPGQPSLPVAYRLYLPEAWAADPARRASAGVPEEVGFATKPEIALDQIRQALADGVPPGAVVTDAGYGNDTDFRDGVTAVGLPYVAGIQGTTSLWPPGTGPLPAAPRGGRGRPPKRLRRDPGRQPLAAGKLAARAAPGRGGGRPPCPRTRGGPSLGGKARPASWPRASRRCGSGRRTATRRGPSRV